MGRTGETVMGRYGEPVMGRYGEPEMGRNGEPAMGRNRAFFHRFSVSLIQLYQWLKNKFRQ